LNQLTYFYEIQQEGHATECCLDAIMEDVQTSEMDEKLASINVGPLSFVC
jgi:hypothetical protein